MTLFAYKGIGPSGKPTSGVRDADSPKALRQLMRRDGVVVTEVNVSKGGVAKAGKVPGTAAPKKGLGREVDLGGLFAGVKKTEIASFTRQLATLLRSGIPLAEALGALFDQIDNVRFKVPIGEVRTAVNEGSSLADALAKHPKIFDELYVSMVRAGELAGNLDVVLGRLADFLDSAQKLRGKVVAAMVYPILMVLVGIGLMVLLMTAVIPKITRVFEMSGQTLPLKTRVLIGFSDFVGSYILILLALAIGGFFLFRWWVKTPDGRVSWDSFVLRLPLIGKLGRKINVARFTRTLGTMLQSGVPMLRALDTSKEIVGNVILRKAIETSKQAVTEGESLATTLKRSGHFPAAMIHMIGTGEKSGQLEAMLNRIADDNEAEVERELQRLTSLLEPLMLVLMAVGVGFVVFSILEPIMKMSQTGR